MINRSLFPNSFTSRDSWTEAANTFLAVLLMRLLLICERSSIRNNVFKGFLWEGDSEFRNRRIAEYIPSRSCRSFSISFFDKGTCCKAYTYVDRTYVVMIFPAICGLVFGLKVPFNRIRCCKNVSKTPFYGIVGLLLVLPDLHCCCTCHCYKGISVIQMYGTK